MAGIFISYRREEASGHAGRLYDALTQRFGEEQVFMDVGIEPGVDFVDKITDTIRTCHVLVAVIGDRWTLVQDEHGRRRLDDPDDFIRLEIESALARPELRVVPVLVQGAKMPEPEDLPPTLAALARRNAIELSDGRWRYDVERLLATLERILEPATELPAVAAAERAPAKRARVGDRRRVGAAAGGLVLAGAIALALLLSGGGGNESGTQRGQSGAYVAPRGELPPVPAGWPRQLRLGLQDDPDGPEKVAARAGPELRYTSLVDVAQVSDRGRDSVAVGALPAFSFYRLSALAEERGYSRGEEADQRRTLEGLQDPAVMKDWFAEYAAFLRAAGAVEKPAVLHLESNLWGFAQLTEKDPARIRVAVRRGIGALRNAPVSAARDDLTEFARVVVALRDKLARNVLLAWNLREWGGGINLATDDAGDDEIDGLARDSARFYEGVGAGFDLAFFDASDNTDLTRNRAANQLRYLRQFMRDTELRAVIARIPLDDADWFLARHNLNEVLEAGALGLMFIGDADSGDGRRYRALAASYYAEPARLTP